MQTTAQGGRNEYSSHCTESNPNFVGLGEICLIRRSHDESGLVSKLYSFLQLVTNIMKKQCMIYESDPTFVGDRVGACW